jgi:hypothetical protein
MRIHSSAAAASALFLSSFIAHSQSPGVTERNDAYHFIDWLGTSHLPDYTEWWYFNLYDSVNNVQAIFSYFVNNPADLKGGLFPVGISEMAAVAYTPKGIVTETDLFLTPAFSAQYGQADVSIGKQNEISVIDRNTYRISGSTRDGRIAWNLLYQRTAPSWFAADRFNVGAQPWQLMSWLLYMPRASVAGTLTVDGAAYQVNAPGYHDHNWGEWDLTGVVWNWAQYSEPGLTFDLGDFPDKPGGIAGIDVNGQRYVFESGQYTLTHTKWAYDPKNKLNYPIQSVFQGDNGTAQLSVTMDVIATDPLSAPMPPPRAVIYEQTVAYTGQATVNGAPLAFTGNGFKEFTAVAQ